jgi:hypothetical protein
LRCDVWSGKRVVADDDDDDAGADDAIGMECAVQIVLTVGRPSVRWCIGRTGYRMPDTGPGAMLRARCAWRGALVVVFVVALIGSDRRIGFRGRPSWDAGPIVVRMVASSERGCCTLIAMRLVGSVEIGCISAWAWNRARDDAAAAIVACGALVLSYRLHGGSCACACD